MMGGLEARGRALAARAVEAARVRVRDAVAAVPGTTPEILDEGVVVRGRALRRRWLNDARLRWIGGWL